MLTVCGYLAMVWPAEVPVVTGIRSWSTEYNDTIVELFLAWRFLTPGRGGLLPCKAWYDTTKSNPPRPGCGLSLVP